MSLRLQMNGLASGRVGRLRPTNENGRERSEAIKAVGRRRPTLPVLLFEDFSILQNNYGQNGDKAAAPPAASTGALATGGCGGLGAILALILAAVCHSLECKDE